mgnify:FL=1
MANDTTLILSCPGIVKTMVQGAGGAMGSPHGQSDGSDIAFYARGSVQYDLADGVSAKVGSCADACAGTELAGLLKFRTGAWPHRLVLNYAEEATIPIAAGSNVKDLSFKWDTDHWVIYGLTGMKVNIEELFI